MQAVVDSSTWISLARSGQLALVTKLGLEPVVLDAVRAECVGDGIAGGHADAAAIEPALAAFPTRPSDPSAATTDHAVLRAALEVGVLIANDLTLGRRARSLGVRWLRTADLVLLGVRSGRVGVDAGRHAIEALRAAGRITPELAEDYRKELT